MVHYFPRATTWLLSLLVVMASLLTPATTLPARAAPTDTPEPVLSEFFYDWSVSNGLLYWAYPCIPGPTLQAATASADYYLRRKPANGGVTRTLSEYDGNPCISKYGNLTPDATGLYFYSLIDTGIYFLPINAPTNPPTPPTEVLDLSPDLAPFEGTRFALLGDYLYWITFGAGNNKILRVKRDGTDFAEMVVAIPGARELVATNNTLYWLDQNGLNSVAANCEPRPCTGQLQVPTNGENLFVGRVGGRFSIFSYAVYWVERGNPEFGGPRKIRRYACSFIIIGCSTGDFYIGGAGWYPGRLGSDGTNLFWAEQYSLSNDPPDGHLLRKALDTNATTPAAEIATNIVDIGLSLAVDNRYVYFYRYQTGTFGIYRLPVDATVIVRDLAADALEVTQGIQNLANEAPLAAKKTTYVRAYARNLSGPNALNAEARLVGTRNGSPLPGSPLRSINGALTLNTGGAYDRARKDDGWLFQLPGSWITTGAVNLQLVVDPRQAYADINRGNNELVKTISFQNQPPVCVWTVPVRTHTPLPSTSDPNFWGMINQFNRRWPVPETWVYRDTDPVEELQVCWAGPFPYPCHGPYELDDGWGITNGPPDRDKVIMSLWARAQLSFNPDACDDIGAPVHFMGMVHPGAENGGASGYASTISNQSWVQLPDHTPNPIPPGWDKMREGSTMAQELAHNHGRKHVNCGGPDNIDNSYPYPPCQIANVGADSYYGFDIATLQPIRPNQTADFMSYANRSWVSDYTWRSLINKFLLTTAAAAAPASADQGNSVFVSGLVDAENNRGEISVVLVLPTATVPPATRQSFIVQTAGISHEEGPHAVFKLRLLDPNGAVLVERTLTLTELDDHSPESHSMLFSDLFPQPAGQVATVQLLADDTVIDTLTPGLTPPTIAIHQPAGGAQIDNSLTLQWTASDPDPDDDLLFTVQYSHDNGASWHTVALDVPSTPDPNYSLTFNDLGSLHGSGPNTALIRILASDGYNTAIATSQPFTLKNRPPEPAIITPGAGQTFAAGEAVLLQGTATDAEDGGLADTALQWQVDGSTYGSGATVAAAGLAPGSHTTALAATDSNSQTVTTTVSFNVAPLTVPISTTPTLDGFCDDAGYAAGSSLQLKPYGDGAQANVLVVRDDNSLWACFSGLQVGVADPGAFAGVRADIDNSRDPLAQPSDAGFFVGEDGSVYTLAGDGTGNFVAPGPGGLQAQVSAVGTAWSAELLIEKAQLGGWDHLVGLNFGHYSVTAQGDDYLWPYRSESNKPNTWATTALGSQPVITALEPFTTTVLGPSFPLTVTGSGFISGTIVLWNGAALPTTVVDGEHLSVQVGAEQIASAAVVQVKAQSPAPGNFVSNEMPFLVEALTPVISSLSPGSVPAENPTLTLTVDGSNFAPDAQVLWNGTPLTTQFVGPTQVKVQIDAALLVNGQTVGVAVRNPQPDERISPAAVFEVQPPLTVTSTIYLPLVVK